MGYQSTKTYGHELGLSCCFRQWRAESHCHFLHGYAISVKFVFDADALDERNWVMDFGGLKAIKTFLEDTFDHKTIIASDDPYLSFFRTGRDLGVLDLIVLPAVGCEKFAEHVFKMIEAWMMENGHFPRVKLTSVEVREHGANSAIYNKTYFDGCACGGSCKS